MALQDMLAGEGFAFIDPHGDTAERLLAMVPRERTEDVIYFSPAEMDYPLGLNLFEFTNEDQKDFLISCLKWKLENDSEGYHPNIWPTDIP